MHCRFILSAGLLLGTAQLLLADGGRYLKQPDAWFRGEEARRIATNILSFQSERGGWPKNLSTTDDPFTGDPSRIEPTFDNGATTDELRFLARVYGAALNDACRDAFLRGFDYVLAAQYPHGGWPQRHPPGTGYARHITFNDHAMVRLMEFVREVSVRDTYAFVDDARRRRAGDAFDRGVQCILKCQIRVGDALTAWCAQHDEVDFQPRPARTYELATLSGAESVGITRLLMSLERPSVEVIRAVDAAVAWFRKAQLRGIREVLVPDEKAPKGMNKVIRQDPDAPPLWARFYDLTTQSPIFVDRDGVPKARMADIGYERRNGYAWYGTWPQQLLEVEYPAWKKRIANEAD